MLVCDVCGEAKDCSKREIEHKEYDICAACWEPLAAKLKGKGRAARKRDIVLLPSSSPQPEAPEPKTPHPDFPPKIWSSTKLQ